MHSVMMVSNESSLEELNELLGEGGWWVNHIAPGSNGAWLVVLTDVNPEEVEMCEEHELETEE